MLLAAVFVSRKIAIQLLVATTLFFTFIAMEYALGRPDRRMAAMVLGATLGVALILLIARPARPADLMLLLMLVGLLPYLYLPLAAAHNPPMNMGDPSTWEGFWHVLLRGQYARPAPLNPIAHAAVFKEQLLWYVRLAAAQFTAPILSIALVPLAALPFLRRPARRSLILTALALLLFSVALLAGLNPKLDLQPTHNLRAIFIPSFALLAILIGYGLVIVIDGLGERLMWKKRDEDPAAE